jgi:tetratricopeptide (TPR) repeat protein
VERGRFEEARPLHDRAFSIIQKKLDPRNPVLAVGQIQRARFLDGFQRFVEAEELRAQGVATLGRLFQDRHNWIAWALRDRARALSRQGRAKEALPPAADAVARCRQLLTAHDPRLADVLLDLAEVQARSGASPREAAREALAIWEKARYAGASAWPGRGRCPRAERGTTPTRR